MHYQEFIPNASLLQEYIDCFWTISFLNQSGFRAGDLVLPDGGIEWVFSRGDGFLRKPICKEQKSVRIEQATLVGPRTKAVYIEQSPKNILFVIRFKPYGLQALGVDFCTGLVDNVVDANLVFGSINKKLTRLLSSKESTEKLLPEIEQLLLHHFQVRKVALCTKKIWSAIIQTKGELHLLQFCKQESISMSTAQRAFYKATGLSPKTMAQIIRMNHMIPAFYTQKSLTEISLEHGFYDQSHMIRNLKKYSRLSPLEMRKQHFDLPKLLGVTNETRKTQQLVENF